MESKFSLYLSFLMLFIFFATTANAERDIARCIDENGDLIYTDSLCITSERSSNPLLMDEQAVDAPIRQNEPRFINAETIASFHLQSATNQAIERCVERFSSYFKRKFPATSAVTSIEFNEITDQYMKGDNVSISIIGALEYVDSSEVRTANVECTVQKFSEGDDWLIGYLNK